MNLWMIDCKLRISSRDHPEENRFPRPHTPATARLYSHFGPGYWSERYADVDNLIMLHLISLRLLLAWRPSYPSPSFKIRFMILKAPFTDGPSAKISQSGGFKLVMTLTAVSRNVQISNAYDTVWTPSFYLTSLCTCCHWIILLFHLGLLFGLFLSLNTSLYAPTGKFNNKLVEEKYHVSESGKSLSRRRFKLVLKSKSRIH